MTPQPRSMSLRRWEPQQLGTGVELVLVSRAMRQAAVHGLARMHPLGCRCTHWWKLAALSDLAVMKWKLTENPWYAVEESSANWSVGAVAGESPP